MIEADLDGEDIYLEKAIFPLRVGRYGRTGFCLVGGDDLTAVVLDDGGDEVFFKTEQGALRAATAFAFAAGVQPLRLIEGA